MLKHSHNIEAALKYLEEHLTADELRQLAGILMGRVGGSAGGLARAKKLTKEERSAIARKAAESRWKQIES